MSNYREFRRRARRRRRQKQLAAVSAVLLAAVLLGGAAWLTLRRKAGGAESVPVSAAADSASVPAATAAPTPAPAADTDWNRSDYAVRVLNTSIAQQDDGTTAMDFRLAAQPECGVVDLSYFDTATFIGDSITQGLELYTEGLPNAHYCAYKGVGPNAIVNNTECTRLDGTKEIPMDALVASQPDEVYILLGTNVLTRLGSETAFLAYYGQMLDMIRQALPGCVIYVQSITPVRPELQRKSPGLNQTRLRGINDELAALALSKGCVFLDLWECLSDENGDLRADFAAKDGYHLQPAGYTAWVNYLRTHTKYRSGVVYEEGTGYYIAG